jgi:hypothetical protein
LSKKESEIPSARPPGAHEAAHSFEDSVLPTELELIALRRKHLFAGGPQPDSLPKPIFEALNRSSAESQQLAERYAGAHRLRPLGLTLSGGGIRSATFSLGVLQGLAQLNFLKHVDYLSTVSGGGYIGAWLHGVINNSGHGNPEEATAILSPSEHPCPGTPTDDPISFLRKYSSYLAPQLGLFSLDLWVIAIIWLRNVLLNQLILLPALVAFMTVFVLLGFVQQLPVDVLLWAYGSSPYGTWLYSIVMLVSAAISLLSLAIALTIMNKNLALVVRQLFPSETARPDDEAPDTREKAFQRASAAVVPCVFVAAILLGSGGPGPLRTDWRTHLVVAIGVIALFALFQVRGGFIECYRERHGRVRMAVAHVTWMVPIASAITCALIYVTWHVIPWDSAGPSSTWVRLTFGPSLIGLSILVGGTVLTGLMGIDYPDAAREWVARIAAGMSLAGVLWAGLLVISVFGPWILALLFGHYGAVGLASLAGWALTTGAGVIIGRSSRTDDREASPGQGRFDWLIGLAPAVFMIGYLLLISAGVHSVLVKTAGPSMPAVAISKQAAPASPEGWLARRLRPVAAYADTYWDSLTLVEVNDDDGQPQPHWDRVWWLLGLVTGCFAVSFAASRRININEFSMHHFYKNRLVRCYLGASNSRKRTPNPFTGFDPNDDFPVSTLVPTLEGGYCGPYPIVNTTLNLNAGVELAQQERKAASFVFTPAFCGFAASSTDNELLPRDFDAEGYRRTVGYAFPPGPHLGTAMAISGAAANPSSGHDTSGPMAFLLTLFDARLGWWLGNPRHRDASRLAGPLFALKYLFAELLGLTTARSRFVNLSDGGHFDNLGLYELVRRRCRYIIVVDAEQDGALTFGSLGGAIRKCRADFGVEIDLTPDPIRLAVNGFSQAHCVVGSVTYPESDAGRLAPFCAGPSTVNSDRARGWILYLKASLTGDEPADVIEYRSRNKQFPHQTTSDQFFSESQFESYRRLGLHIVRDAFKGQSSTMDRAPEDMLLDTFQSLAANWYPPNPVSPETSSRLSSSYADLMRVLGQRPDLKPLVSELLGNAPAASSFTRPPLDESSRLLLIEVIQLIQNVYSEYRLEDEGNRANPRNAGWMRVVERWSNSPAVREVWKDIRQDYNPLFKRFMDERLARPTDVPPQP